MVTSGVRRTQQGIHPQGRGLQEENFVIEPIPRDDTIAVPIRDHSLGLALALNYYVDPAINNEGLYKYRLFSTGTGMKTGKLKICACEDTLVGTDG